MDKNEAWGVFAATGKVEDYLRYAAAENKSSACASSINTEDKNEDQYRWSDTDRTDDKGK